MNPDRPVVDEASVVNAVGVGVRRSGCQLLSDVDLRAGVGEVVGLIGPNGAGKSTLLRVLAGVFAPDRGRVTIAGLDVASTPPRLMARRLAHVDQHSPMMFSFTARDYVLLGRHAHLRRFEVEGADDLDVADAALAAVGMSALADRDITTMSGGERQLVAIALGLAQQPQVLLLDEPTSALDLGHQLRVLDLVSTIAASGVTVVAAVHDLDLAARMCDRLVLIVGGRCIADGPADDVLTPTLLRHAYDADTVVRPSPDTGSPTVTAIRPAPTPDHQMIGPQSGGTLR